MYSKKKVLVLVILAFLFTGCSTCSNDYTKFSEKYFQEAYQPTWLTIQDIKGSPDEYFIQKIPWISYKDAICQTASLQMLSNKSGIEKPRDYFSFLLGYTYGAVYIKGAGRFMSYGDPEPGFILAAHNLGFERRYFVTDDENIFLKALRYFLSKDYPIRIAWNSVPSIKYGIEFGYFTPTKDWKEPPKKAVSPHNVVFVGYDKNNFYFYETQGKDQHITGEKGIKIPEQVVLEAVISLSSNFRLPWKYMFTIFEQGAKQENLTKIFERNGNEMIGYAFGPTSTGSLAIEGLAYGLEIEGTKIGEQNKRKYFKNTMQSLSKIRSDNADFLAQYFKEDQQIQNASELLKEASNKYAKIFQIMNKEILLEKDVLEMISLLKGAALSERKAGKIFLDYSKR